MEMPGGLPPIMYFVVLSSKSAFFKLQDIFPECLLYREHSPQIDPMMCLAEDNACTMGRNCMETLAKRVNLLFQEMLTGVGVVVLYFKRREAGYGAGIFWRDMREPRVIIMNPFAWSRVKSRGNIYQFTPASSFFLSGKAPDPSPTIETAGLENKV